MQSSMESVKDELEKNGIEYELKYLPTRYPDIELFTDKSNVEKAERILLQHLPAIAGRKVIAR
ncbi:hypothetical protein CIW60_12860 [Enterobacter roggenkampii]|uniref:hypothetical protein n=1 Tax=Enterobacter roggenkampii TaxID=1812935 RepID=UPI000BA85340|nr:hypothetical protein [Enterobacter roggenkampii]PAO09850.1 hypothetical protein CIW60_12860 [Enterobacter roggenkampii]